METSPKHVVMIVTIGIAAALVLSISRFNISQSQGGKNLASLVLYFTPTSARTFQGEVTDNMTLLEALDASARAGNFDFRFAIDNKGRTQLFAIDGKKQNFGGNWLFFINGNSINTTALSSTPVKSGDNIVAKFVTK